MGTPTSAELGAAFDCEGGLDDFEPEPENERGLSWRRVASPTALERARWEPYVAPPPRSRSWPIVMPAVVAAAIAGAAVSWVGLRVGAEADVPIVAARVAPIPTAPARTFSETEPVAPPAPAPLASAPPAATVVPRAPANPAFESTLAAVSRAYRDRDLGQLTAV